MSDSKSPQVSRTLLNILAVLSRFILRFPSHPAPLPRLWEPFQVRQLQLVSPSLSCSTAFLVLGQDPSICLSFRFLLFSPRGLNDKVHFKANFLFFFSLFFFFSFFFFSFLYYLVFWQGLDDMFVSQNPRRFHISFSRIDSGFCIYHLVVWLNFNFLNNSQWLTFPIHSCLVLLLLC